MYTYALLLTTILTTSHSLGGAQALLAGMDLYQREPRLSKNNLAIHTVGMPRTGNPAFAYYVDSTGITVSRSVNNRDSKNLLHKVGLVHIYYY